MSLVIGCIHACTVLMCNIHTATGGVIATVVGSVFGLVGFGVVVVVVVVIVFAILKYKKNAHSQKETQNEFPMVEIKDRKAVTETDVSFLCFVK